MEKFLTEHPMLIALIVFAALFLYIWAIAEEAMFMYGTSKTYWERNIDNKRIPNRKEKWFMSPKFKAIDYIITLLPPLGFIITILLFKKEYWCQRDVIVDAFFEELKKNNDRQ